MMISRVVINVIIDLVVFLYIFLLMVFNQVVFGSFLSYLAMRISHKNRANVIEETEETKSGLLVVLIICTLLNSNISLTHTNLCLNVVGMFGFYFLLIWNAYVYLYVNKKTNKGTTTTGVVISMKLIKKYLTPMLKYACVFVYDVIAPPMERDYWHYLACFVLFLGLYIPLKWLIYILGAIDLTGNRSITHWVFYWVFTISVILIDKDE